MRTLLKFKVTNANTSQVNCTTSVRLEAVTDGSEENKKFWKYTPAGTLDFTTEPERAERFKIDQEYFVTLSDKMLTNVVEPLEIEGEVTNTEAVEDITPTLKEIIEAEDCNFLYEHLPPHLQLISKPFALLAAQMFKLNPRRQRSEGYQRLLEAKDAMVRAAIK